MTSKILLTITVIFICLTGMTFTMMGAIFAIPGSPETAAPDLDIIFNVMIGLTVLLPCIGGALIVWIWSAKSKQEAKRDKK